ncbi:MAG: hypothetical protein V2J26_04045 [Pacificimonas sp.]|jgi:hypothetical protein|nr:hypothetical protein [Pacificimonas sp.]
MSGKAIDIEDLITDRDGPKDPGYDEWVREKVRAARQELEDGAETIPAEQVWRELQIDR